MTSAGWIALAISIFGAFAYAAGSILQAVGARRSVNTVKTLGHPLYLIGVTLDMAAWVGSMVALGTLAVYLVESVLASSLALTVLAARIFLKSHLRNRDIVAVAVSIAALTVIAMSAGPQEAVAASTGLRIGFLSAAVMLAGIGWAAARAAPPGVVAAIAGLSLGGAAVAGRALPVPDQPMADIPATLLSVATEPLTWALVTFGVSGMVLYTHALQKGQVGPVTAVLWIAEVIAPSAVALALLGDTVRAGWELPAALAALVTVGAAVMLATAPATDATARPQEALPAAPARPALSRAPQRAVAAGTVATADGGRFAPRGAPGVFAAATASARQPDMFAAATASARRPDVFAAAEPTGPIRPPHPAGGHVFAQREPTQDLRELPDVPVHDPAEGPPRTHAEHRVIWWGAPPIWTPPARPGAAAIEAGRQPVPELTWSPPTVQPMWTDPQPADSDAIMVSGEAVQELRWEDVRAFAVEPVKARRRPWDDA
ncbi:hypothetical protein GCM10010435_72730 [Winogradskya consettensis]|uniref:DMT family transporter n=1 Tax=Winogradskya consettensis TaxID=113560 RepID=A0A919T3T4_9ACTN|nr:hypothetical protein [Actinoplanes consettensis]GIM83650.1 hypothetical protein Aco04nite_87620 [Actinoplanes consettensis]